MTLSGSAYALLTAQGRADELEWTPPAGADRCALILRSQATNVKLLATQAVLNRGSRPAHPSENTDPADVRQYAYEGDTPIVDDATDANGTLVTDHIPSGSPGRGLKYTRFQPVGSGARDMEVQANQFKRKAETAGVALRVAYINDEPLISPAYKVEADIVMVASAGTDVRAVLYARWTGTNNSYVVDLRGNGDVVLRKMVAGVFTDLGTYSIVGFLNTTSYKITLQVTDGAKNVFVDGVERISSVDNALTSAGQAGVGFRIDATTGATERPTIDNLKVTYVQNTTSPPAPPVPPGLPEPPPDSPL